MQLIDVIKLLSPIDLVVLTLETQALVKKTEINDCIPASFLIPKVEKFITIGEFPTRNITYWNVSEGKSKDEVPDWQERLINELTNSNMTIKVQELDNSKDILEISCEIYMIAHNCTQLSKELLKEVKCATVRTAFGQISVEL